MSEPTPEPWPVYDAPPTEGARQAPYVQTRVWAEDLTEDGPMRQVLVTVEAITRVPDPLQPGDPFTGFGNFEISIDTRARVSELPSIWPLPASPLDTTFCTPGMTSCEVNPDLFLEKDQSFVFRVMLDVPCEAYLVQPWVVSARPDGYGRPDVVYDGRTGVGGNDDCDPVEEDDTPRHIIRSQGLPLGPGGKVDPFGYWRY